MRSFWSLIENDKYKIGCTGKADFVINNEYGFDDDLKKCVEDIRVKSELHL